MKPLKLIISSILLIIWFVATIILALAAIITVFPAIALIAFPELLILWFAPALFLLVYGGWIDPPSEEGIQTFLEDLDNPEDYH